MAGVGTAVSLPVSVLAEQFELCWKLPEVRVGQRVLNSRGLMHFSLWVFWTEHTKSEAHIYECLGSNWTIYFFLPWLLLSRPQERLSGITFVGQSFPASRECDICFLCSGTFASPPPPSNDRNPRWNLMLCRHVAFSCMTCMLKFIHTFCLWMFGLLCFEEQCCYEYSYTCHLVNMYTSFSWLCTCKWSFWVEGCVHIQFCWAVLNSILKWE